MKRFKQEAALLDDCLAGEELMDGVQIAQFILFAESFLLGGVIGLLYDFLRCFRRAMRLKIWGTAVCDLIFCSLSLFALFSFCINLGIGQNRAYILAGAAIGWAVYAMMLGKIANTLFLSIFKGIRKAFGIVKSIVIKVYLVVSHLVTKLLGEKKLFKLKKNTSIFARKGLK